MISMMICFCYAPSYSQLSMCIHRSGMTQSQTIHIVKYFHYCLMCRQRIAFVLMQKPEPETLCAVEHFEQHQRKTRTEKTVWQTRVEETYVCNICVFHIEKVFLFQLCGNNERNQRCTHYTIQYHHPGLNIVCDDVIVVMYFVCSDFSVYIIQY